MHFVDLATGEPKPLGLDGMFLEDLSPDDKTMYFTEQDQNQNQKQPVRLSALDLSTGQKREIFTLPGPVASSRFLMTSDGITFVGWWFDSKASMVHFFCVNVDGADYREIYTLASRDFRNNFTLSKDGRWMVLAKRRQDDNWQLLRVPVKGGESQDMGVVLERALMDRSIELSPDGSRIAFSTSKYTPELWALDNVLGEIK